MCEPVVSVAGGFAPQFASRGFDRDPLGVMAEGHRRHGPAIRMIMDGAERGRLHRPRAERWSDRWACLGCGLTAGPFDDDGAALLARLHKQVMSSARGSPSRRW